MFFAVATTDGISINQHFGHSERFLIYEIEGNEVRLVDEKKVERYCSYDEEHPLRGHILRDIAVALAGCRAIVCARIGDAPQTEMERLGIEVFVAEAPVVPTLLELSKLL